MRRSLLLVTGAVAATVAAAAWWRRNPRCGSGFVNRIVDPWLVRRGVVTKSRGEIGLIEHVGRRTGTVRVSPVHPVLTGDGVRIVVPLGSESQWARNVVAAGHCRLQIGDVVHEFDEPALVAPSTVDGIPRFTARVMDWLGFRYLRLHRFAEYPGTLAVPGAAVPEAAEPEPVAGTN